MVMSFVKFSFCGADGVGGHALGSKGVGWVKEASRQAQTMAATMQTPSKPCCYQAAI